MHTKKYVAMLIALITILSAIPSFSIVSNAEDTEIQLKANSTYTCNIIAPESKNYNINIVWKPLESGPDIILNLGIDGKNPLNDSLKLLREWKNFNDKPRIDAMGNEYAQEQVETGEYINSILRDYTGVHVEPFEFYLDSGEHTINITVDSDIILKEVILSEPEKVNTYNDISKNYELENIEQDIICIEGENADIKNSNSISPKSNNSDAGMSDCNPYTTKINYIGGTAWQLPGSALTWSINVEESGYYYLNFRYKQADLVNGESSRWLKIDGKTPFSECKNIKFPYGTSWEQYTFSDENNPYYFYLTKGEHSITLEATAGEQAKYFERLKKIVDKLGDTYIQIVMITSESPDPNRDYELFNQIPDFEKTLQECYDGLISVADDMNKAQGSNNTQASATIRNMARVIKNMLRTPYYAQQYVTDYYTNYASVSSWLYDMVKMPLSIDQIQIVPYSSNPNDKSVGLFSKLKYGFIRFLTSFVSDYSISGYAEEGQESIRIWVNWGQDQTAVLNSLINDSFTPKTGIHVQLEVVNASLINGILAGNFPDLSLHMARTDPVNLGVRGALYDLTNFDDYKDVLKRFMDGAEIPYTYNNSLYALPDTQSFLIMFYRNDVLSQLGLKVPNTWDEFLQAATVIQRKNMNVYIPYTQITTATTVNAGIGSLNLFPTFMAQNNLSIYNKELNATTFTNDATIDVFKYWTDLYTKHSIVKEAEFYNRLRIGIMPLGIAPYTVYMNLYSAAPEIQGRWSIACLPSTNGNGTVAGAGTGCSIVAKSPNKEQAWEFLKWWTSADTQSRYSSNVESILGTIGRVTTANVEAFKKLSWERKDLAILLEQWNRVSEVPEVPGSYYMTRSIDQAYWSVINGDSEETDAMTKWGEVADDEIIRKINECTEGEFK